MNTLKNSWIILTLAGFTLFILSLFIFPAAEFFDESYYLANVDLFKKYHFHDDFFIRYKGPAGPTFAWVHYLFEPFTKLQLLPSRFINVLVSLAVFGVFMAIVQKVQDKSNAFKGLNFLLIPTTFLATGFVITNMPTMLFFLLAILVAHTLLFSSNSFKRGLFLNVLLMCCLALSVLGRQTYLLALPVILAWGFYINKFNIITTVQKLYGVILAAIPIGYVFYVWKGIQPPVTLFVQNGWRIDHFFFAFGYAGVFVLFLTPQFFYKLKSKMELAMLLVGFGIVYIINFMFQFTDKVPMRNLINKILPDYLLSYWATLVSSILISFSLYFIFTLLIRMYEQRHQSFYLFAGLCSVAILSTSIKITHQFSALYTYQAMPLILLMALPYDKIDTAKLWRSIVLIVLGFANYYYYT